jgi:hypothetical protein
MLKVALACLVCLTATTIAFAEENDDTTPSSGITTFSCIVDSRGSGENITLRLVRMTSRTGRDLGEWGSIERTIDVPVPGSYALAKTISSLRGAPATLERTGNILKVTNANIDLSVDFSRRIGDGFNGQGRYLAALSATLPEGAPFAIEKRGAECLYF